MDTKRNRFSEAPQKKGGKDVTKVVLTAAGATIVGAGGALGASELLNGGDIDDDLDIEEIDDEQVEQQDDKPEQEPEQQPQPQPAPQQPVQQPVEDPNEIQPVDNNTVANNNSPAQEPTQGPAQNNEVGQQTGGGTPDPALNDVDPNQIAQEITATEVDPNDVDVADMISVDNVDTMYFEDGSEMPVAAVHTSDGGQYLMIDVDNDMTFDVITDLEGNPLTAVDGNLTMSDIEDMMDETGGELAYNPDRDEQELAHGENPEDGIVDTEGGDLAMVDREVFDEEEVDEGEIADDDMADMQDDDLAMDDSMMEDDII